MKIKANIRMNVHLNTNPLGIKKGIEEQIDFVKAQPKLKNAPKNALVLGGAAGYGLATRIALAFGGDTKTISVSRGGAPRGKRTGSAGYWSALYFDKLAKEAGIDSKSFFLDVFSHESRKIIADYIRKEYGKLELLVYSIAAGVRVNPDNGEKIVSSLKPVGKAIDTFTIDIDTLSKKELKVEAASQDEIDNTVYCMGGGDWKLWVEFLLQEDLLAKNFKTVTYTYIGGEVTKDIYRDGTIGFAKKNLEQSAKELDLLLKNKVDGRAYVSSSKAIVSKASVFIPSMVVYGSALFEAMLNQNKHESIIQHKHRLLNDFIYNDFSDVLIRLDEFELDSNVQKEVLKHMELFNKDSAAFFNLKGAKLFIDNFYKVNGFNFNDVDYETDIDLEKLQKNLEANQ